MADVNKRIVVEVDAQDAEASLSPVRRVLEDITRTSQYSGEAVSSAFENALKGAKNLEEVLKRVKDELSEIGKNQPNFGLERENLSKDYGKRIGEMAPGAARQNMVKERNAALARLRTDEEGQASFNNEFDETSKRLITALTELNDTEKRKVQNGAGADNQQSYLGGLLAQRNALINQQLAAPTRKEASLHAKNLSRVNQEIASATTHDRSSGAALRNGGVGAASSLFGADVGVFGAAIAGGGIAAIALELGNILKNGIEMGMKTAQSTNRASLVAPSSVSPFGPTGPNGEELENSLFDTRTGMSPSERTEYYLNFVRQRGRSTRNSGLGAYHQALLENAYGMDRGELIPLQRFRMRDTGNTSITNLTEAFIQASKQSNLFGFGKDDYSQLSDRIGNVIQLTRDQQQNMNSISIPASFSTIMMGQQIGGRFADRDTQVGLFGQLNSSIRSPNNNFRRAFIYQQLQQAHPGASFYELQEMAENGIYGGNLKNILGGLEAPGEGAGRDEKEEYLLRLQGLTGLSYQNSRTLGTAIMRNPNVLNMGNTDKLLEKLGIHPGVTDNQGRTVQQRAEASLTFQQDMGSFFKQKLSNIGVGINNIAEGINGANGTNGLLKSFLSTPFTYIAPGTGFIMGMIDKNKDAHKSKN